MSDSRREFLRRAGMLAMTGALAPRSMLGAPLRAAAPAQPLRATRGMADPHALAAAAVDAARQAGASYADARLSYLRRRTFDVFPGESELLGLGVRALFGGYWGFASSNFWTADEAVRLGREAVGQAKANALGRDRVVELGSIPAAVGEWRTPIETDPFDIGTTELDDYVKGLGAYGAALGLIPNVGVGFSKEELTFASSEGAACSQTLYRSSQGTLINYKGRQWTIGGVSAQGGFEVVRSVPLREIYLRTKAEIDEDDKLPIKPVEVGRYQTLFDQRAMAGLIGQTIGYATELDRALGYEANAGGSSYLNDPLAMLGSYKAASPVVTISAERSRRGSIATTKWDAEGVVPEPFTIVKDGQLVDFQTSRESAAWLRDWYAKRGMPVRSHGCANAPSALDPAMQHTPNLALHPGSADLGFDEMLAGMTNGLAIRTLRINMDWQRSSGDAVNTTDQLFEVKRGKRTARIRGAGILFRATDLWRSCLALGGPKSQEWIAAGVSEKGEPSQATGYTVGSVPALFKDVTIIDRNRKA